MYGISSTNKSRKIIKDTIESTVDTTNNVGITDIHPSEKTINKAVKDLDYPFRKVMHLSEYTILCILMINALYQSGLRNKKLYLISIFLCFIYACTDEIHQLYRARTGEFKDVLIDTLGALIGIIICLIINKIYTKRRNNVQ
jgi:VanZ family protein